MLYEFVTMYRDEIIARSREKLSARPWPSASAQELETGVPLFLTQLSETLRSESVDPPRAESPIGCAAARHGRDLLTLGFTVSQVVHGYGDICQALTEIAIEHTAPITIDEFRTLNGCLDTAIAEAVTEHARITADARSGEEFERSAHIAHETRDLLNTALLAYQALKLGAVAMNGSTGAALGRSLMDLRDLVDGTLSEIRIGANQQRRERVAVTSFLADIAVAGGLHAESRSLKFATEPGDPRWAVNADPQLLASAVMSLLNNAFKYTRPGGHVVLRAIAPDASRLLIEVEDECGGVADVKHDLFQPFGQRRGRDRTGLGLGLSIARKAVRAHAGDIAFRNVPDKGCVAVIDIPRAADEGSPTATP